MSLKFTGESRFQIPGGVPVPVEGEIGAGEIVGLQGPSGCGKSTFLRHLAQAEEIAFAAFLDGKDVRTLVPARRKISLVFQKALLFPHLDVRENVRFPLRFQDPFRNWSRDDQEKRVAKFLEELSLSHLATRDVSKLSGGEAMRIALLRAMVSAPKCLLLDEAFSALDKEAKARVKSWLKEIIRELKIATLLVAHVQEDLVDFADRTVSWPPPSHPLRF